MANIIEVQYATGEKDVPVRKTVRRWVASCLEGMNEDVEISIRIVDEPEIQELNRKWRGTGEATNVLSFPAGEMRVKPRLLGDIVLCAPVIAREAVTQRKAPRAHWAHMVIHGLLHLLGYDHVKQKDAMVMESLERKKLKALKYPDPYS